jgi:hypothetical protein
MEGFGSAELEDWIILPRGEAVPCKNWQRIFDVGMSGLLVKRGKRENVEVDNR